MMNQFKDENLHFIVGMPRCGITFLSRCINAHPQMVVFGQSRFWERYYLNPQNPKGYNKIESLQRLAHLALTTYYSISSATPEYMYNYVYTKVAEYLMTGTPIIAIEDGEILGNIIKKHNLGSTLKPNCPVLLAECILNYEKNPELRINQCKSAKKYALNNHDRQKVMDNFVRCLDEE